MKHADLIRAALDGKQIQTRVTMGGGYTGEWQNLDTRLAVAQMAAEYQNHIYRVEPKPDVVTYRNLYNRACLVAVWNTAAAAKDAENADLLCTIKVVMDGETGKLKSVGIVDA